MTDTSTDVVSYDPPRIEERAPIGYPLIGTNSIPPP
jgi:hypothetical protein